MTNKMLNSKIAEPYASALLDLAVSTHTVDYITADVSDLLKIFNENEELVNYLTNPLYSKTAKKKVLEDLITSKFLSQNTTRFLMILIDRSRIDLVQTIAEKYLKKVYELAAIKIAQVTSAAPLSANQEVDIISQIKKRTGAKEIKLITSVDKSLLGGLQVQIGSTVIDVSLKGQLRALADQLETTLF
jgi:F-type H+-transporting ATPase subunit delta